MGLLGTHCVIIVCIIDWELSRHCGCVCVLNIFTKQYAVRNLIIIIL